MKKYVSVALLSFLIPMLLVSPSFAAVDLLGDSCVNNRGQGACKDANTAGGKIGAAKVIKNIVNGLLYLIGAMAVIMIVYGGFRYVTSAGDPTAVQAAKNVILYAVIGLLVAMAAFAVVNFVVGRIW